MTTKLRLVINQGMKKKGKGDAAPTSKEDLTPGVRSLMGSFKAPKGFDFDYKKSLRTEKK